MESAIEALTAEWHDEAILACERALKEDPACAEAVFLLGLINLDLDEPAGAITLLEKAHELQPEVGEYAEALAAILVRLGKVGDGLFYAKLATTLAPHPTIRNLLPPRFGTFFKNLRTGNPHLYLGRAERKLDAGSFQEAIEDCRRQLKLTPDDIGTWRLLAQANLECGRFETAMSSYHAVLHADTPEASDLAGLGRALAALGRSDEALACQATALRMAPFDAALHSRLVADLTRRPGTSQAQLADAHDDWRDRHAAAIVPRSIAPAEPRDPDRPLRIAYLSGTFCQADFVELFAPVLLRHDPKRVQAYCYNNSKRRDAAIEGLMRAAVKWTEIDGIDDETVWQILRGDDIDIAVDLSGHLPGGRPLVFARRAAPVTVSWLGHFHPLGLDGIDHFLTDRVAWPGGADGTPPPGGAWRIDRTAFAYQPPSGVPAVSPSPAAASGQVTFGVSCDLRLLTPDLVSVWAELLWRRGTARLMVCNRFDQDAASIERVLGLVSHFGLRDRVDVANMAENFRSDLAFYDHVDIALDTGSFGSLVENCRALWKGVPVVAFPGAHPAARLAASMLSGAGRSEWVARTPEALGAVAAGLSDDIGALAALRAVLQDEVRRSPLGDPAGLTAALEGAYRQMWRNRVGV